MQLCKYKSELKFEYLGSQCDHVHFSYGRLKNNKVPPLKFSGLGRKRPRQRSSGLFSMRLPVCQRPLDLSTLQPPSPAPPLILSPHAAAPEVSSSESDR